MGLEKPLSRGSSSKCWNIRVLKTVPMMEAWIAKLQRKAKALLSYLSEKSLILFGWS